MPSRRAGLAVLLTIGAFALTGCNTHHVAATNRCPVALRYVAGGAVVVAPKHEAGLAKLDLTPASLEAEQD
jgi:hypothetical protein